jgi:methylthioribulose-1-phosphate dehydratase
MTASLETSPEPDSPAFARAVQVLIEAGRRIYQRGWVPATSGNFSVRLDDQSCAITVSGRDKGALAAADIMRVDLDGKPLDNKKPSAETLLHTRLYRRDATIGTVLHTHSINATLVSMAAEPGTALRLQGLELLKAFRGTDSHTGSVTIPVFDNTQDIAALAEEVDEFMTSQETGHAYLIRGHGIYTWGRDMPEAMRHLEAMEYLMEYHWRSNSPRHQ